MTNSTTTPTTKSTTTPTTASAQRAAYDDTFRGVLLESTANTEDGQNQIVLAIPTTDYRLHLVVTERPLDTPIGQAVPGRIDVRANRVEKSYYQSPLLQPENYRPFLLEGLSQGKLTRMPQVTIHDRFRTFFEDTLKSLYSDDSSGGPLMLLPDIETSVSLSDVCPSISDKTQPLLFAVGPEGGWVPFEIDLMEGLGFRRFSLGRWTLRVEHAVTAVLSQLELLRMR